jgi:hypothetical protein
MAGTLEREEQDSPQSKDALDRQRHSSGGSLDGAVTGNSGTFRIVVIVGLFLMLTCIGAVWFGVHPFFKSLDFRFPSHHPTSAPPAPAAPTLVPSP